MKNEPLKRPCRDCPWRKEHPAGWLGGFDPEWFTERVLKERPINCHLTLEDHEKIERLKATGGEDAIIAAHPICAGSLIVQRNMGKLPRDPKFAAIVQSVERSPDVFSNTMEFLEHHDKR